MKVCFVSDLQLEAAPDLGNGAEYGPGSRFADQEANLDAVAALASEEGCELVCVLGDVFERAIPRPWSILAFQRFVRTVRDNGARVLCILGNHDVKSAALPPALSIFGEEGVAVALGPSLYPVGDVVVATLPWTPISRLVAERPADDRDSLNDIAAQALVDTAYQLGERCAIEHPDATSILIGHWAVSGGTLPTGLPVAMLREPVLSLEGIAGAGFDLACFGHIHHSEVLNSSPPVISCGSPMVMSWGEAEQPHGCWIFDSAAPSLRFVALEDKPFVTLAFDHEDPVAQITMSHKLGWSDFSGCMVRFRYTANEDQARRIDEASIRRELLAAGALKVVFRPTIVRAVRARVAEMDEGLDETAAFELWLASQDGSVSVDPEALRALHSEYIAKARI